MLNKVLICDDELDTHLFIEIALEESGAKIFRAWDGEQAIEMVKSEKPDIVIMDYKLPKIDGLESSKKIKEIDEKIPIILLTGVNIDPEIREKGKLLTDAFLVKPFEKNELIETINKLIKKS